MDNQVSLIKIGQIKKISIYTHLSLIGFLLFVFFIPLNVNDLIGFLLAFMVHEGAHIASLMLSSDEDFNYDSMILYPFGGHWEARHRGICIKKAPHHSFIFSLTPFFAHCICILIVTIGITLFPSLEASFTRIIYFQIVWIIFHLLPLAPLDGHALLFSFFDEKRVTGLLSIIFNFGAIFFSLIAFENASLMIAFLFTTLFICQFNRYSSITLSEAFQDILAEEIMVPADKTDAFFLTDSVTACCKKAKRSLQEFFPIMSENKVVGIITRTDLLKALLQDSFSESSRPLYLAEVVNKQFKKINPKTLVGLVCSLNDIHKNSAFIVVDEENKYRGIISLKSILEIIHIEKKLP